MNLRLPVPAGIDFGTPWGTFVTATDAGVVKLAGLTTPAYWSINSGGTKIDFYKNMAAATWTTSGGKRVYCEAWYEF